MLRLLRGDLHVHTCLSPCADKDMLPGRILERAANCGLDFIGISDHNSTDNVPAVRSRSASTRIAVLGGIEITTREEVHVLAFFDDDLALHEIDRIAGENLPPTPNDPAVFGEQLIVGPDDQYLEISDRLLIGATSLGIEEVVNTIHKLGGIAIASHVDRPSFSVISQLGFVHPELGLDAVEVSTRFNGTESLPLPPGLPMLRFSDAHRLDEIGSTSTKFLVASPCVSEIRMALLGQASRKVVV